MKKLLMIGLGLLICGSNAMASRMLCDGSALPGHSETLSFSGGAYTFIEDYNYTDGVLGDWANKASMYVCSQWPEMGPNTITLMSDEGIWQPDAIYSGLIMYNFIVPVSNATVDFSVSLRCGATVRVAPTEAGIWGVESSELAIGANTAGVWNYPEYTGTIPSISLNTSVPGQTSFSLIVINNNGLSGPYTDAAGIDQLIITAVPEPVTLVMMTIGLFGFALKRRQASL